MRIIELIPKDSIFDQSKCGIGGHLPYNLDLGLYDLFLNNSVKKELHGHWFSMPEGMVIVFKILFSEVSQSE